MTLTNTQKLGEVSMWNFEEGTSLKNFGDNNMDGDTLALFFDDNAGKTTSEWTILTGVKEGFLNESINVVNGDNPQMSLDWNAGGYFEGKLASNGAEFKLEQVEDKIKITIA